MNKKEKDYALLNEISIKEKKEYRTYNNIKPKSREEELELIAFYEMSGEDIINTLEAINPELAEEYGRLAYGD